MNTAGKFIALALAAYGAKQFEEAGCLFAQAAECSDVTKLTDALLQPIDGNCPSSQQPILGENQQQLSSEDEEGEEAEGEDNEDWDPEDGEEGDEEDDELASESSDSTSTGPTRRRVTSMYQIGKILAASMEATSSDEGVMGPDEEEDEDPDEEDIMPEPDPDIPGASLVPASFSSSLKLGFAANSPVKLKQ